MDGERIEHSVIISSGGQRLAWNCKRFSDLGPTHFAHLAELDTELVIFGSGSKIRFPQPDWLQPLMQRQLGLETMDSQAACRTYNILAAEGRRVVVALLIGVLYTLPNFFGEAPAVQVSSAKVVVKVDSTTLSRVEEALKGAGIAADLITLDGTSIKARFGNTETQLKAKDALQKALNPDMGNAGYVVALNLLSRSPTWLTSLGAVPMYLGLDLRGGVHFMLQVDMQAALTKRAESLSGDVRTTLREKNIRHSGINRNGQTIEVRFRDAAGFIGGRL